MENKKTQNKKTKSREIYISPHSYYIDIDLNEKTILNKKVIAHNGEIIGRAKRIIFKETQINGILVQGKNLNIFIDLNYIEKLYSDSIMLKINPITRFIGMKVYDWQGTKLGRVIEIQRISNANTLTGIKVKKGIFSKKQEYPADMIDISTKNIILKNGSSKNESRT